MPFQYPWFASTHNVGAIDRTVVVYTATYVVCAEWLLVCRYVENCVGDTEDLLTDFKDPASRETQIDRCLSRAQRWRIHVREFRETVQETLDQSFPVAARLTLGTTNPPQTILVLENIIPDFKRVSKILEGLETRVDRLIDRCTGEMQLAAARGSLAESHNLARLIWLGTIFVPLEFMAGLFSINENIGSLKDTLVTYFASAIPVAIVALLVARWGAYLAAVVRVVLGMVWRR
jgi:Mg2+ and Co2+ transporter CorA